MHGRRGVFAVTALACALFFTLLALVVGTTTLLQHLDRVATNRLDQFAAAHPAIAHSASTVSDIGAPLVFEVLAGIGCVVALVTRRFAQFLAIVGVLAADLALGHFLKILVDRPRPVASQALAYATGPSFPSSHALSSSAIIGVALVVITPLLRRQARVASIAVGALVVVAIGLSRVLLGVHYVSDVVGGWLLGATIVLTAAALLSDEPATPGESGRRELNR